MKILKKLSSYKNEKNDGKKCIVANNFFLILPILFISVFFTTSLVPHSTFAADKCTVKSDGVTESDDFKIDTSQKLISTVVKSVQDKLKDTSKKLYEHITADSGFIDAVRALLGLYIVLYGLMFTVGIVELKFNDFIIRLAKLGVVAILLSNASWTTFNSIVVTFFNNGTDQLINEITKIAVGGVTETITPAGQADGTAFDALDKAISKAISSKMFVTLAATLPSNVYGLIFGAMLAISLFLFLKSLLSAMFVYIMSLAMRTLLFGLAPIFIPMIMFERTKHLFQGWLNQLVNASLQPIMMFLFFAFFVHLMDAAMDQVMQAPVCWTRMPEGWRGSALDTYFWRFADVENGTLKEHTGDWPADKKFPVPLMAILTFMILAELASRFNGAVIQIATQISSAAVNLNGMENIFSGISNGGRRLLGGAGNGRNSAVPAGKGNFGSAISGIGRAGGGR